MRDYRTVNRMKANECPYGASDCPKVKTLEDDIKHIRQTLYLVVIFLAAQFGTTFLQMVIR